MKRNNNITRKGIGRISLLFALCSFIFALSSLLFTACQQEEDIALQEQEIRINFTTDAIQTRVNTFGTGDVWETGDEIRLQRLMNEQADDYFFTATVDEDGTLTWTPNKKLCWVGNDAHILLAKYPDIEYAFDTFYIPADQTTLTKLKKADCMNAFWKGTPTTEPITLTLKHRMSMVTVTYTLTEEFESTVAINPEVYSYTQYIFFNDRNNYERRDNSHDAIWVKPYKHEEVDDDGKIVAKKFTAIVSPDVYAAGAEFIRVYVGDAEPLIAKMKENITFKEGYHYTFNLKVGKDKVTLTQVSASTDFPGGWDKEQNLN